MVNYIFIADIYNYVIFNFMIPSHYFGERGLNKTAVSTPNIATIRNRNYWHLKGNRN